ncbi:hypothetical protein N431DRAFT_320852 [Stipitochalara longipes BDJ]|nr:hypothetical protein N431DRAFT_320852 [Stipitochalara longipes BDJ]
MRELFTKIYIVILACSIALFSSTLLVLRSSSLDTELSSTFIARSVAPQDATTTTISTTATFSTTTTISSLAGTSSISSASPISTTPVEIFQVFSPVLGSTGLIGSNGPVGNTSATEASGTSCQVTLMEHSFGDSFGKPFVGNYTPPACMGNANTVMMNFSVVSQGVQFDRLALMYFGDTEVFRTSTAEPKKSGIVWEYVKDMSHYMYFWKSPQVLIFDLPNQVTTNLTGSYNTTLTATFLNAKESINAADMILPISARMGLNASMPSVFSVPAANATNTISFPRNANRAVFSISSCGQGDEEFWWSNVLQSDNASFTAEGDTTFGFSPFREVQVYIDGMLAGVQWPFAVIFTGGVVPAFWSPIVGIDAFDLKEYEIDISPWLGLLCDGNQHTFTMKVAGLQDNGGSTATISESVGNSWSLTGKIFIWLDAEGSITTGAMPSITAPQPNIIVSQSHTQNSTGSNETLLYTTSVQRTLSITSTIKTANGTSTWQPQWSQTLSHTDNGTIGAFGNTQINIISTTGKDSSFGLFPYSNTYSYPFFANSTAIPLSNGSTIFVAAVARTKSQTVLGSTIYPSGLQPFASLPQSSSLVLTLAGTSLANTQTGNATLLLTPGDVNKTFSFGTTQQQMRFGGVSAQGALGMEPDTELFFRSVKAVNGTVKEDVQRLVGKGVVDFSQADVDAESTGGVNVGMEAMVGRMPMGNIEGMSNFA